MSVTNDASLGLEHFAGNGTVINADGTLVSDEVAMIALSVFVKEEGRWWVTARANVLTAQ